MTWPLAHLGWRSGVAGQRHRRKSSAESEEESRLKKAAAGTVKKYSVIEVNEG